MRVPPDALGDSYRDLQTLARYGKRLGVRVELQYLQRMPRFWDTYSRQAHSLAIAWEPSHVTVAITPKTKPTVAAVGLAHELGHTRQPFDVDRPWAIVWEEECDAWREAILLYDTLGLAWGPEESAQALEALRTYGNVSNDLTDYLEGDV